MQTANVNVPVKVTGRHVSVTEAIKDYATSRIEHLHLDYPRIIEAHVILDVEKHRHFAEIILHCTNHITIEASQETDDMYASIDGVVGKIAQQMRRNPRRRSSATIVPVDNPSATSKSKSSKSAPPSTKPRKPRPRSSKPSVTPSSRCTSTRPCSKSRCPPGSLSSSSMPSPRK